MEERNATIIELNETLINQKNYLENLKANNENFTHVLNEKEKIVLDLNKVIIDQKKSIEKLILSQKVINGDESNSEEIKKKVRELKSMESKIERDLSVKIEELNDTNAKLIDENNKIQQVIDQVANSFEAKLFLAQEENIRLNKRIIDMKAIVEKCECSTIEKQDLKAQNKTLINNTWKNQEDLRIAQVKN